MREEITVLSVVGHVVRVCVAGKAKPLKSLSIEGRIYLHPAITHTHLSSSFLQICLDLVRYRRSCIKPKMHVYT